MKAIILFVSILFSVSQSFAMNSQVGSQLKCMFEFSKALGVAVADTLPVSSAVVDDFVDGGKAQKSDGVFMAAAELMGGALSFASEMGLLVLVSSGGSLPVFDPGVFFTASSVPYRSTKKQWRKMQRNCDRRLVTYKN